MLQVPKETPINMANPELADRFACHIQDIQEDRRLQISDNQIGDLECEFFYPIPRYIKSRSRRPP